MTSTVLSPPALRARSTAVADDSPLLDRLDPARPLAFLRQGDGIVGIGEAARIELDGPDRLEHAAAAWRALAGRADVVDEVGVRGSGLVAFGVFAFDDSSGSSSCLIVPELVVGRRAGRSFVTRIGDGDRDLPAPRATARACRAALAPGLIDEDAYRLAVAAAVERIRRGPLGKVVLARDLEGRIPSPLDLRTPIAALALGYPDTWTYAVDGMIGSSPETLVTVADRRLTARVLAGSAARGDDARSDAAAAAALATSVKDLDEHGYAVRSVLASLRAVAPGVTASEEPFTLRLPNLWHLASDVEGRVDAGTGALDLVRALHPTAAVAGSPRADALEAIRELEAVDRGRYAGPVGWIDAAGDGEWAIALRGAQVSPDGAVRAFAGAGIVERSDPERELVETSLKFRPVCEAFG